MTRKHHLCSYLSLSRLFHKCRNMRILLAIDVIKTRIQVDPALKGHSLLSGGRRIVSSEGPSALLTGFG